MISQLEFGNSLFLFLKYSIYFLKFIGIWINMNKYMNSLTLKMILAYALPVIQEEILLQLDFHQEYLESLILKKQVF